MWLGHMGRIDEESFGKKGRWKQRWVNVYLEKDREVGGVKKALVDRWISVVEVRERASESRPKSDFLLPKAASLRNGMAGDMPGTYDAAVHFWPGVFERANWRILLRCNDIFTDGLFTEYWLS